MDRNSPINKGIFLLAVLLTATSCYDAISYLMLTWPELPSGWNLIIFLLKFSAFLVGVFGIMKWKTVQMGKIVLAVLSLNAASFFAKFLEK